MKKFWYTVSAASNDPTTMNDVFCFCCSIRLSQGYPLACAQIHELATSKTLASTQSLQRPVELETGQQSAFLSDCLARVVPFCVA